ncbi:hypothetical protein NKDENANG_00928 [Candidatus Entotheonellaceae bacterium PAL068K]
MCRPCWPTCGPTNLDKPGLTDLFNRYGGKVYVEKIEELLGSLSTVSSFRTVEELSEREDKAHLDDFAAAHVASAQELQQQFAGHLFSGCEADDVSTACAFDK